MPAAEPSLPGLVRLVDRVTAGVGSVTTWLTVAMVLITVVIVTQRYLFAAGSIALQESVMYLHGTVFMLGLAYGLKHDTHVRVDVLYGRLGPRGRERVNLCGHVLLLLPVALLILWSSLHYVASSWRVHEGSPEVGGLPFIYLLKTLIPVTAVLLIVQGVAEILRSLQKLRVASDG